MGIFLFLIVFLLLILFFTLVRGKEVGSNEKVELRGLDGSSLIFTQSGVTFAGKDGIKFFSSSAIKRFSIERDGENFVIVVSDGTQEVRVPVSPDEVRKLFREKSPSSHVLEPLFPYLPVLSGFTAGLLLGTLLERPPVIVEEGSDSKGSERDLNSPDSDYFDTEEWFDDDEI